MEDKIILNSTYLVQNRFTVVGTMPKNQTP